MDYLVPAWHELMEDWATTVPKIAFDDATSHMQLLQNTQNKAGLVITDYQPQLMTKLNEMALAPSKIFSVFDYLQGVNHFASRIIDLHDLNWPDDTSFNYTAFRVYAIRKDRLYAKVAFDNQGKILAVEYYDQQGRINRILDFDSRGFISRERRLDNQRPVLHIYYDEQGHWRFKHHLQSDEVEINADLPRFTKQLQYSRLTDLVSEIVETQFLAHLHKEDNLIVTMDDQSMVKNETFAKLRPVYSVSGWHPFQKTLQVLRGEANQGILVDSEETSAMLKKAYVVAIQTGVIPLFPSQFKLGHSQRISQQRIGVFVEDVDPNMLRPIIELVYQRLLKNPKGEALYMFVYTSEKEQLANQMIEELKAAHPGEFKLKPEKPMLKRSIPDEDDQTPELEIRVHRWTNNNDVMSALDKIRLVIDWGERPDSFLQMATINVGIPQIRQVGTAAIVDRKNGFVCENMLQLPVALSYYMDSLKNWNMALTYDVQMLNQYSEENMLKVWQRVTAK
ncbi:accessory Sec system protein Asp1 [uncultured Limosilactobacillus sp.]|uniref:accessory Sec system protein Asp1 n=1 Tax=uncultured Limosilactobacillus sp. TaxID=2837629 RepID=UPI0026EA095D|nr:accessory Sec system protein Asp1 [uncultured Limosilactobacillus sp.]